MNTLSEHESKVLLGTLGIVFPEEFVTYSAEEAVAAAIGLGAPVVAKVGASSIAHKSESGFVALNLRTSEEVHVAVSDLLLRSHDTGSDRHVLIAPMIRGHRELIIGYVVDAMWGPLVVLGHGGVLAEVLNTAVMLPAPVDRLEAMRCVDRLDSAGVLGEVRDEPAVDREALVDLLVSLGALAGHPKVESAEMNPVIISGGMPVPVDALVQLGTELTTASQRVEPTFQPRPRHWQALFEPRSVAISGVSDHPGKFGSVAFHNIRVGGYKGEVFPINRSGKQCFGHDTLASIADLPANEVDCVVICTPAESVSDAIRAAAAKGITSAVVCSAGFSEIGSEGRELEREVERAASENGVLLIGPNVQGIVSTPAQLVAQIVGPAPVPGGISVVSQSGNISSTLQNLVSESGAGIARAVSLGNSAQTGVLETLEYLATDTHTDAIVLYVESFGMPTRLRERLRSITQAKPVVCVKGGRSAAGSIAAATHTGALAGDTAVFLEMARSCGLSLAEDPESAVDLALGLAAYPVLAGPRVAILTTVGGWGVLTVDAIEQSGLRCAELDAETIENLNVVLPPRWSHQNPIDLAGGETTDSVVHALSVLGNAHEVDAVVLLGVGIQSNEAGLMRMGREMGLPNLDRMIAFHERQDLRYVEAAHHVYSETGTPVLIATELGHTLAEAPAFTELRAHNMPWFRTGVRAIRALDAVWERSRFLAQ